MNLKTKVIAAEVSNLTDARYFAAWGVDYMSYSIDESIEGFIGLDGAPLHNTNRWRYPLYTPVSVKNVIDRYNKTREVEEEHPQGSKDV